MLVLIPLLLLFIVTLFYVATKEGLEDKKDQKELGNPNLNKKAVHVDLDKNSVELPNHVSGIVSEDLDMGGNINIMNENRIELGKGNKKKGPASGTIQYKGDFLNIIGAGKDGDKSKIKLWDDVEIGSLLHVGDQLSVAGPLKVNSSIDIGPKDKRVDAGKIQYGDMLEITGAGKGSDPRKIKLSDDVEIGGMLQSKNQTGIDQTITGTQSVNNQTVTGIQTLNNSQKLLGGQEVAGVSSYKGKVNINPTDTDRRNMVDLSIGDELTGFRKGDKSIMFTGNTKEVGGFDADGLFVNKQAPLEFGKGIVKEVNAGKIAYKKFSDGLDIVGASPEGVTSYNTDRKIKMWDNVEVQGGLTVKGPIDMPQLKQGAQFTVGNEIEFAKGTQKEQNAGKINYKIHGQESLDIVGASPGNTTNWGQNRRVHIYDDAMVFRDLEVGRNLNVKGAIKTDVTGIEFGPQLYGQGKKEVNAGKIVYNGWGNHLAIVGATQGETNNWNPRKVHIFDELSVGMNLKVNDQINGKKINATDTITIGNWNIYEDSQGMLRFSKKGTDRNAIWGTNQNGIGLYEDGNIWMSREVWSGWMAEGIRYGDRYTADKKWVKTETFDKATNAQDTATTAFNKASNTYNIRQEGYWNVVSDSRGDKFLHGNGGETYVRGSPGSEYWKRFN